MHASYFPLLHMAEQQSRVDADTFLGQIHSQIPQRPDIEGGTLEYMKQDAVPVLASQAVQVAINTMRSRMKDKSFVYAGDLVVLEEAVNAEFGGWMRGCVHDVPAFDAKKTAFLAAARQTFADLLRSRRQEMVA